MCAIPLLLGGQSWQHASEKDGLKSVLRPKLCWFSINLDNTAEQEKTLASHFYAHQHAAYACWASDIHADKHAPCHLRRIGFLPMFSSQLQEEKKCIQQAQGVPFQPKMQLSVLKQVAATGDQRPQGRFCALLWTVPCDAPSTNLLSCAPKASKLGWRDRQANVTHRATNISLSTSISFLLIKFVSSKLFLQVMFWAFLMFGHLLWTLSGWLAYLSPCC